LAARKSWRVVAENGGHAGDRVEDLLHRGTDAALARSPARRRRERLHRARQVEQVPALGVVEPQRSGERVEHAGGGAGHVAPFQPRVVGDAHAGQDRDFLAA